MAKRSLPMRQLEAYLRNKTKWKRDICLCCSPPHWLLVFEGHHWRKSLSGPLPNTQRAISTRSCLWWILFGKRSNSKNERRWGSWFSEREGGGLGFFPAGPPPPGSPPVPHCCMILGYRMRSNLTGWVGLRFHHKFTHGPLAACSFGLQGDEGWLFTASLVFDSVASLSALPGTLNIRIQLCAV